MFCEPHFNLLARLYKRIVVPIPSPWSRRNIEHRNELPISNVDRLQPEIIANGRRNIEPGGVVGGRSDSQRLTSRARPGFVTFPILASSRMVKTNQAVSEGV